MIIYRGTVARSFESVSVRSFKRRMTSLLESGVESKNAIFLIMTIRKYSFLSLFQRLPDHIPNYETYDKDHTTSTSI